MKSKTYLNTPIENVIEYFTVERMIWALIICGLFVYGNAFFNGFVMDDEGLILKNQNIHTFQLIHFFQGSMFDYGGSLGGVYYRPVQSILFSAIYSIFGDHAFMYHLIQVVLHITNAIFLLFFFKKYFARYVSFVIAFVFLLHPLQVEAVSYIASMQDVLFVFFGLLYVLTLRQWYEHRRFIGFPYIFLLCSMLSKESGLLFLPIGLLYIFFFKKTQRSIHGFITASVFVLYLFLRVFVARMGIHTSSEFIMMRTPLLERMMSAPAIVWFYIKTFVFPLDLVAVQSWIVTEFSFQYFFLPLFFTVLFFGTLMYISYMVWKKTKQYQLLLFFWMWFLLGLSLHMQVTPLDVTVADRYFYFPMIGLLGLIGVFLNQTNIQTYFKKHHLIPVVFCICIFLFYAGRVILRNNDWMDTKTLAIHDLTIQPDNYQLLSGLGAVYLGEQDYKNAIYYLQKSVTLYPYWGISQYNLAVSYHMSGHPKEAKKYYEISIKNAPFYVNAYENMAILSLYSDTPQHTKEYAEINLKKFPMSAKMWQVLTIANIKLGKIKEASQSALMYKAITSPPVQ